MRSPAVFPPRRWRIGAHGLGNRFTPFSVLHQLWKAATALWHHYITINGGSRSSGTRCGPSCITSIVAPQTAQRRQRGFSDGRFPIFLKRCSPTSEPYLGPGNENASL